MPAARDIVFWIEIGGRSYSGEWRLEGNDVVVSSPLGSARGRWIGETPEEVAQKLLRRIVAKAASPTRAPQRDT